MEMELNKQKINFYNGVFETCVSHVESTEIIIPDASPDLVRTLSGHGSAYVKEKNVNDGCCTINGEITGCVLYIADGEKQVRKLDVSMPYTHNFESKEIGRDTECIVCADLIALETREINSRKIAIKANVIMQIKCYCKSQAEVTCDIENKREFAIEIQTKTSDFYAPILIKEKSFTIIDDVEMPSSLPALENMIKNDVNLNCTDIKLIGNKVITKGIAEIKYTYVSKDGSMNIASLNLPYSQIIDVDDFNEDCDMSIKMNIRACDIEASHDMTGEARYISVNILVDTTLIAYYSEKITFTDDLYSITHEIDATYEEIPVTVMRNNSSKRISFNEIIETTNNVKKIIESNVILSPVRKMSNYVECDAYIQVMYLNEDEELYCIQRRSSIKCDIELIEKSEFISCSAQANSTSASGKGNKISVQFFVDYDFKEISKDKISNLCRLVCLGKSVKENPEAIVIVKHIYKEEPLWELAKRHNTTIDEIAAANCLDYTDKVAAGSMLLIPCGK